ncbi:MAG: type IV secretion system DNA-binding domain-containing protein [Patescibacteria group bacterium]|nr:type IV secretion system DNA-binding domain-containing protein [Patescibacteria group bacterium]
MSPENQTDESLITFFGRTNFREVGRDFGIRKKDRRQHMYVIGKTGVGKTELLKNMALQDVESGHGLAIIDPHGEFVEEVLDQIPPHRTNDVVYFNPADIDNPVGFNILQVPDVQYKHLVASGLMGIFTKIWANVWSARMEYIMNNCLLALLDTPNTTLLGITRILVDKDYRQKIIDNVKDPVVRSFWINEYASWREQFRNEAIAPIQNKVGQFLSASLIRNIIGQSKSTIDIQDIMDNRKILLVNVSKGLVGEDNSALLGAMIITKIQLAAMERVRIESEKRQDFFLYVDEFQNFVTESFADILSEARKYRLNLILAHQYVGQLVTDTTTKVRDAVFGNVGSLITFRVGAADAEFLEKEFEPRFYVQDLVNLENYNIYLRLMINGVTSCPFSATTLPPRKIDDERKLNRKKVIRVSRERYANSREEVEEKINRWSGMWNDSEFTAPSGDGGAAILDNKEPDPSLKDPEAIHPDNCWACGKDVKLKFMPDGKRPIFCKNCLARSRSEQSKTGKPILLPYKPKEGVKKVQPESMSQEPRKVESSPELETMGIGADPPSASSPAPKLSASNNSSRKATSFREQESSQKKRTQTSHKKKEIDLKSVRDAINDAMKRKDGADDGK